MFKFLKALSVFTGTIIGVGIFGLPYAASRAGFFVILFFFLIISAVSIFNHLLYGEISLGTKGYHRLPGYAQIYLGRGWKNLTAVAFVFSIIGAILAYLIVGGEFLNLFFSQFFGGNNLIYTLLFFALGAYLIFRGIQNICKIELALLGVFFVILITFFIKAIPFIDVSNFQTVDWQFFTFPYGIILFSLWGLTTIPEIKEILEGNRKIVRRVIISGILLATISYLFFVATILGVSGANTSKEAMSGFSLVVGDGVASLGFLFGTITCFTSFIALGLVLKKMFWCDFGLNKNLSWFVACFLPLGLFLIGFKEFIDIIGLVGAFGVGLIGTIVVLIYKKFLKRTKQKKMHLLLWSLPVLMILGVFFETYYFVFVK